MTKVFVSQFSAAKGYGFIEPIAGGGKAFIPHMFLKVVRIVGLKYLHDVTFNVEADGNGNPYVANLMLA